MTAAEQKQSPAHASSQQTGEGLTPLQKIMNLTREEQVMRLRAALNPVENKKASIVDHPIKP